MTNLYGAMEIGNWVLGIRPALDGSMPHDIVDGERTMDSSLLTHLLALVERTGDRLIVVDPASQKPVVLMGLAQYEALLGTATHADQRGVHAETRGTYTDIHEATDGGAGVGIAPGTDPIARRGNAELAAWRAETPTDVAAPEPVVLPQSVPTMESFSIEPLQSATRTDDQFYVEPIE